jgi:hypothetical protein
MGSVQSHSLANVARVAWAMAEKEKAKLDRIENELKEGNDREALILMRDYFHIKNNQ